MTKVLVLGAGASRPAGYPTAAGLLAAVREYCLSSSLTGLAENWRQWVAFRDEMSAGPFASCVRSADVEVIFSVLDLVERGRDAHLQSMFDEAKLVDQGTGGAAEKLKFHKEAYRDDDVRRVLLARRALLECVVHFFQSRSTDEAGQPNLRAGLCRELEQLDEGDTVITFNWDTTAERTLAELGRWNPSTGYGIDKPLEVHARERRPAQIYPSQVCVLKLHGSTGWERCEQQPGLVYFNKPYFRQHMPGPSEHARFLDPERLSDAERDYEPLMIVPSFLKAVPSTGAMQAIWSAAHTALARADRVEVWGYSLPPSDSAARVLLNVLRPRMKDPLISVVVTDPSPEVGQRWNEFLDAGVWREGQLQ